MVLTRVVFAGIVLASALLAQSDLKVTPGFDLAAIDRAANPCDNFYQYACGNWLKNNPIPADQASWGRFSELAERNRAILRQILDQASSVASAKNDPDTQKIGDYYGSCMDQKAIDAKGLERLQPFLLTPLLIHAGAVIVADLLRVGIVLSGGNGGSLIQNLAENRPVSLSQFAESAPACLIGGYGIVLQPVPAGVLVKIIAGIRRAVDRREVESRS